ncbi:hypothetical protein [Lactococcus garvieae]|uniref:hypothetical protein n=1 Tax=Lactococcus garvieae TaxID=1363 RepID=UPI003852EF6A
MNQNEMPSKLMSIETREELTQLILDKLIEKECTLSNFEEVVDSVHCYFKNNATV